MVGDAGAVIFIREYAGLEPGATNRKAAYEDGTDRTFRNVGIYKPDVGELP